MNQNLHSKRLQGWQGHLLYHSLFLLLLLLPLLLGKEAFGHKDARMEVYPFLTLLHGRIGTVSMLWNDINFHGFPHFVTNGYIFHPLFYLLLPLLSSVSTLHWTIFFYLLGGAVCCTQVLKREGFSNYASMAVGAVFCLRLWPWMFAPGNAFILLLTPLLLLALQTATQRTKKAIVMGSASIAFAWLGAHFHYAVILMAVGLFFAAAQMVKQKQNRKKFLLAVLSMYVIGTTIGLLRILPALGYAALSSRGALVELESRTIGTLFPFLYVLPDFSAPFLSGSIEVLPYMGAVPLALVLIAVGSRWRSSLVWACLGTYIFSVLLAVPHSPLLALLSVLPGFRALGSPARWILIGATALLPLCAAGFDLVIRDAGKAQQYVARGMCLVGGLLAAASALASLLPTLLESFQGSIARSFDARFSVYLETIPSKAAEALGTHREYLQIFVSRFLPSLAERVSTQYGLLQAHMLFPILTLLAGGLLLMPRFWEKIPAAKRGTVLFTGCTASLLLVYVPLQWSRTVERGNLEEPSKTVVFLQENAQRSFSFLPSRGLREQLQLRNATQEEILSAQKHIMFTNQNLLWGIDTADYYEPLHPLRMARLVGAIGSEIVRLPEAESLAHSSLSMEETLRVLQQRRFVVNLLGIDHLVSTWPLEQAGFRKVHTEDVAEGKMLVSVYENPDTLPFAYFPKEIETMEPDPDGAYERLLGLRGNTPATLIECTECAGKERHSGLGKITVEYKEPTRVGLSTSSTEDQWLVVSQNFLPGWHMLLDGNRSPVSLANTVFPAVRLPAGNHEVILQFTYRQLLEDSIALLRNPQASLWL
ncbi:hypothetical protein COU76_02105 [Candidatus Peregrinibacteria bacterium CG10_big_fil_rev_8_21_14_0_10_49_10]|nr:MAG: hypothetical protein COU76_02105 [Candidatus Peregrinibacteria bacterium CG10_big_fil_rev_8_21_14_0_10_49_10]